LGSERDTSKSIDLKKQSYKALYDNKYILVVSHISDDLYLVKLNPLLHQFTKQNWSEEIKEHVDEFYKEMSPEKKRILELLVFREDEEDDESEINFDLKSIISPYYDCLRIEGGDEDGFWLCFRSCYYLEEFEARSNIKLIDEVWINNNRIKIESDVDKSGGD
jgi:hypothetical protein